jgi:hemerythrin-like metal-binding protein
MAYLEWSEQFSVNVAEIDEQHKIMIGMINTLSQAMQEGKGRELQKQIIGQMVAYATTHFALEEGQMLRLGFPGYLKHKEEHDNFMAKALELQARYNEAGFVLTLEVLRFLNDWLKEHVLGTDKEYTQHFNAHGLF